MGGDLPQQLGQLFAFAGLKEWPQNHPFGPISPAPSHPPMEPVRAAPDDSPLPPIFLLGSSDFSARLAAEVGLGFAFAGQINPDEAVPMLRLYRELFQPSDLWTEPYAIFSHNAICAPTDEEAARLAAPSRVAFRRLRAGEPTPLPTVEEALAEDSPPRPPSNGIEGLRIVTGSPTTVRETYEELLSRSGADELMLMCSTHDPADRVRSYELIAEAFGLEGRGRARRPPTPVSRSVGQLGRDPLRVEAVPLGAQVLEVGEQRVDAARPLAGLVEHVDDCVGPG